MNFQWSDISKYAAQLGVFFLILLGVAIPLSVSATHIIGGLILLCFCLSGQYKLRFMTVLKTPYARMSLIFWVGMLILGLMGCLIDDVPWRDMMGRLMGYKKLLIIVLIVGLFATTESYKLARFCFLALLVGALINLLTIFLVNISNSTWIVAHSAVPGFTVFSNSISTGFVFCLLYWCSGVLWLEGGPWKSYWLGIFCAVTIFLLTLNVNRTSFIVFAVLTLGLLRLTLKLHRQKQEGQPWGNWVKILLVLVMSTYVGGYLLNHSRAQDWDIQTGATVVESTKGILSNAKEQLKRSIESFQQIAQEDYSSSIGIRVHFYKNALPLIAANPVLGCGTGCVSHAYTQAYGVEKNPDQVTDNLHNEYFNLLVQTGVVGLFVFFLWLSSLWKSVLAPMPYTAAFRWGIVTMFLLFCIFNSSLMDVQEGWLFCYFTGLCIAPKRMN